MPSARHSVWRGLIALASFIFPLVVAHFPEYMNLTIGSVIFAALHYVETKYIM